MMRLRHQYLIAGVAWACLLSPAAFLLLFGFAAGASWLWLFGDNPWPAATQWVLPLIAFTGAAVIALVCVLTGYEYGKARERRVATSLRSEQQRIVVLTGIPFALVVLIGVNGWWESQNYARDMEIAAKREAAFAALTGARYRITGIRIDQIEQDRFRVTVRMKGAREGSYHLHWQIADTGFRAVLADGNEAIVLREPDAQAEISFTLDQLAQSYRANVLKGRAGVLVEEPFRLSAWLEPVFSEDERQALPPGERRRVGTAESSLRSQSTIQFPVRFLVREADSDQ